MPHQEMVARRYPEAQCRRGTPWLPQSCTERSGALVRLCGSGLGRSGTGPGNDGDAGVAGCRFAAGTCKENRRTGRGGLAASLPRWSSDRPWRPGPRGRCSRRGAGRSTASARTAARRRQGPGRPAYLRCRRLAARPLSWASFRPMIAAWSSRRWTVPPPGTSFPTTPSRSAGRGGGAPGPVRGVPGEDRSAAHGAGSRVRIRRGA
jgi:hypothetical protein